MNCELRYSIIVLLIAISLSSCKKEDNSFYEYSNPTFAVFKNSTEPESIFAYCASHDIYLDSVYVYSPIDIQYKRYFHGQQYAQEVHFLIGDSFVTTAGTWSFVFYGRKVINGIAFKSFAERELQ
jgi:hypothetical protein